MGQTHDEGPWYRQGWFWFVMSPLLVVIVVSLTFAGISIFYADDRVVDNYYQHGRTINQSFEQDARARALGLSAEVRFDRVSGEAFVTLDSEASLPETLHLRIGHPINAERDQRVTLQRVREGHYRGDLVAPVDHRRYLTLLPEHEPGNLRSAEWLLRGEIRFEQGDSVRLRPSGLGD